MKDIYPSKVKKLLAVFTSRPAETTQELRQKVMTYAARLSGAVRAAEEVPEEIEGYIDKVARHAYKYYNLALSISLGKIAGRAFRIGHLGDLNEMSSILIFHLQLEDLQ